MKTTWKASEETIRRGAYRSSKAWLVADDKDDDDDDDYYYKCMMAYKALVEWYCKGKFEVLGEKTFPMTHRPPQNSHRMNWDWTGGSAARPRSNSRHLRLDIFSNTRKTFIPKSRKQHSDSYAGNIFIVAWKVFRGACHQLRPPDIYVYYRDLKDAP
jgi:hypothetical protein